MVVVIKYVVVAMDGGKYKKINHSGLSNGEVMNIIGRKMTEKKHRSKRDYNRKNKKWMKLDENDNA